jgi:hypothetical protein
MIILGFTLVAFGLLVETQALWLVGATLVGAGAVVGLLAGPARRPYTGWTEQTPR